MLRLSAKSASSLLERGPIVCASSLMCQLFDFMMFGPAFCRSGELQGGRNSRNRTGVGRSRAKKQKERRTKAAPPAPARGLTKQHLADAPLRGRGTSTAFVSSRAREGSSWRFPEEAVLDARASIKLSVWPVSRSQDHWHLPLELVSSAGPPDHL